MELTSSEAGERGSRNILGGVHCGLNKETGQFGVLRRCVAQEALCARVTKLRCNASPDCAPTEGS